MPGWHTTIFPPYFVAGAIYSGFAMVLVLAIPLRYFYGLQDFITDQHLQNMAKVMLATCMIVGYGYGLEAFMSWYSDNPLRSVRATQPHVRRVRVELLAAACCATSRFHKCCGRAAFAATYQCCSPSRWSC